MEQDEMHILDVVRQIRDQVMIVHMAACGMKSACGEDEDHIDAIANVSAEVAVDLTLLFRRLERHADSGWIPTRPGMKAV